MKGIFEPLFFSSMLVLALSAPTPLPLPLPQDNPFAILGNFIQRLQSSFNEGSESVRQAPPPPPLQSNGIFPDVPETADGPSSVTPTTASATPTTTPRTTIRTSRPPTQRPRPTNPFDSINAILDNISRGSSSNNNNVPVSNNNIFGSVPGRNLPDADSFSTPRPSFFPPPPPPTSQPFNLDGINQGINAFFQAFIKTNIDKLFKQGDRDRKHSIQPRSDPPQGPPPGLGDILFSTIFGKPKQR